MCSQVQKPHLGCVCVCVCVCVRSCPTAGQYWVWSVSYPRHAGNYADFSASFTQWPAAPHFPFSLSLSLSLSISPHCLILIHTQHTPPDELWRSAVCVCVCVCVCRWQWESEKESEREWKRNQGTVWQKLMLFRSGKNCIWLWRESGPADLMRTH